jgi:uncharacterized protein YlxW (UPF0749 family)
VRIAAVLVVAIAVLAGDLALTRTGDAPEAGAEIARLRAELAAERSAREQLAAQVARLEGDLASLKRYSGMTITNVAGRVVGEMRPAFELTGV